MTTPKYKHFKFEDRYVIQEFLRLNYSFTAIANRLKKDRRAVSKEILKHRFLKVGANKRKLDCTKPDKPHYVCNAISPLTWDVISKTNVKLYWQMHTYELF